MGFWRWLRGFWRSGTVARDYESELLALARAMHPEATDAQLVTHLLTHLLTHAPEEGDYQPDPLADESLLPESLLRREFARVEEKIGGNLVRLSGKAYPEARKRTVMLGTLRLLVRLDELAMAAGDLAMDDAARLAGRAAARRAAVEALVASTVPTGLGGSG